MKRILAISAAALLLACPAYAEDMDTTYSDENGTYSYSYDSYSGTSSYTYQSNDDTSSSYYVYEDGSTYSEESDAYGTTTTYYDNTVGTFTTNYYSNDDYVSDGDDYEYGTWYGTQMNNTWYDRKDTNTSNSTQKRTSYYVSYSANATPYQTTSRSLRVRSGPGTDYAVLTALPEGTTVYVTSISHGWASIVMNDGRVSACVSARYLIPVQTRTSDRVVSTVQNTPAPQAAENNYDGFKTVSYIAIVNPMNSYVNMRWEASKSSEIRKVYYYGTELKVLAENSTWCQVYDESTGEVGFIMKKLLLPKAEQAQPTETTETK